MKPTWSTAARYLILLLATPVLMAGSCNSSNPLDEDEEKCNFGSDEEQCRISVSMRNSSNQLIHLWTENETIGPLNQLSAAAERCRAVTVQLGSTHTFTVSAGRDGNQLDTRSITLTTISDNTIINADWSGTALSPLTSRTGTLPVCA